MSARLVEALSILAAAAAPGEVAHLRTLLSLAAGQLAPVDRALTRAPAPPLAVICELLHSLFQGKLLWRGYPPFLDGQQLHELQREAMEQRVQSQRNNACWLSVPGELGERLASSPELLQLVTSWGGQCTAGRPMYTYYLESGDHLAFHLDEPDAAISAILMLTHLASSSGPNSRLLVLDERGEAQDVDLKPGELLIFNGSTLLHGRESIRDGEEIHLLVFTFHSPKKP